MRFFIYGKDFHQLFNCEPEEGILFAKDIIRKEISGISKIDVIYNCFNLRLDGIGEFGLVAFNSNNESFSFVVIPDPQWHVDRLVNMIDQSIMTDGSEIWHLANHISRLGCVWDKYLYEEDDDFLFDEGATPLPQIMDSHIDDAWFAD